VLVEFDLDNTHEFARLGLVPDDGGQRGLGSARLRNTSTASAAASAVTSAYARTRRAYPPARPAAIGTASRATLAVEETLLERVGCTNAIFLQAADSAPTGITGASDG
jgi:hypothetical protein